MAFGGGDFVLHNKKIPGTYINFISMNQLPSPFAERGIAAIPWEHSWGPEAAVSVDSDQFLNNARKYYGYPFDAPELMPIRELFSKARTVLTYRVNTTGGNAAENKYGVSKCVGERGNKISTIITASTTSTEDAPLLDVITTLDNFVVDTQTNTSETTSNLEDNDWVVWKRDVALEMTAGTPMAGGIDGTATNDGYLEFLSEMESKTVHVIGLPSDDLTLKKVFATYAERMRNEVGKKLQVALYNYPGDHEGVINVKSGLLNEATNKEINSPDMVCWVTGARAACAINRTLTNAKYNGELKPYNKYTQTELTNAISAGEFVFHQVDGESRVLDDINSFVTLTNEKGVDFQSNQTIAVLDQIAIDTATIFQDRYLGVVQNNQSGRESLWGDLVSHRNQLEGLEAIEGFDPAELQVLPIEGNKKAVRVDEVIRVVNAMQQIYCTVYVA